MWFSTHWVFLVRFKDGVQESYPVLERVVLVEAFDDGEARKKAALMAKQEQDDFTGAYHWAGGRRADLEFIGVRKVVVVSTEDGGSEVKFAEGQELTCWEYDAREEEDVRKLVDGERVSVDHIQ
jgi:hypothetical protein